MSARPMSEIAEIKELFAFVSKDRDEGKFGLKQGFTVNGLTPLVSVRQDRLQQDWLRDQLQSMHVQGRGETVYLVRYEAVEIIEVLAP